MLPVRPLVWGQKGGLRNVIAKRWRQAAFRLTSGLRAEEYGWGKVKFRDESPLPWNVELPLRQWLDAEGQVRYRERIQKADPHEQYVALVYLEDETGKPVPETCWP